MAQLFRKSILLNVVCTIAVLLTFSHNVESFRKRILQGGFARQSDFKYHVSIQRYHQHLCGGAIIDEQFVLTAAHCFFANGTMTSRDKLTVRSGTNHVAGAGFVSDVEEVIVSTDYVTTYSHGNYDVMDIALIKLKQKFNLNGITVQKINLPVAFSSSPLDGEIAKIAGYGYTEKADIRYDENNEVKVTGSVSSLLKTIDVVIVNCQHFEEPEKSEKHICTYVPRYDDDQKRYGECYGDSGSPLVYDNTVVGIVSTGPPLCGERNWPATYTRVSYYLTFIDNAMKGLRGNGISIYKLSERTGQYYWS